MKQLVYLSCALLLLNFQLFCKESSYAWQQWIAKIRVQNITQFNIKWAEKIKGVGGYTRPLIPAYFTSSKSTHSMLEWPSIWYRLWVIKLPDSDPIAAQILAELQESHDIEWIEPDKKLELCQWQNMMLPDDADFYLQWYLFNSKSITERGLDIRAPEAWAVTTGDRNIIVAIIDSGIDFFHPDLAKNIWYNEKEIPGNGVDDDGNGYVDDYRGFDFVNRDPDPWDELGHGTHVAGIIGAIGNNGRGIAGVAWNVRLMPLKAFSADGKAYVSDVIEAIWYALYHNAQIINASWGSIEESIALTEVIRNVTQCGILVVCAAGNQRTDRPFYPAALKETIAVAAIDDEGKKAIFSNYGPWIDICAPGVAIYSTWPNNTYWELSGTSMAAPLVSGTAALVWSLHPEFTANEIRNAIIQTADEIASDLGHGMLNVARAVQVIASLPEVELDIPSELSGQVRITGRVNGENLVYWKLFIKQESEQWHEIGSGTNVVINTLVEQFDTTSLADGPIEFRLEAYDIWGQRSKAIAKSWIRNVFISTPATGDVLRYGSIIPIYGASTGKGEMLRIEWSNQWKPTLWQTTGIQLLAQDQSPGVKLLGYWDTSAAFPDEVYHLRISLWKEGSMIKAATNSVIFLSSQIREGWPVYIPTPSQLLTNEWRQVTVADLDNDGSEEILIVSPGSPEGQPTMLIVLNLDGSIRWTQPIGRGMPYYDVPTLGDINGDGLPEIVSGADETGLIYAFSCDGSLIPGWPVKIAGIEAGKIAIDLDRDGKDEIIACASRKSPEGPVGRELAVFKGDGTKIASWILGVRGDSQIPIPMSFPAIGDLDGDGSLEIVAISGRQVISAFSIKNPTEAIWSYGLPGIIYSSPVVADLDNDGKAEVVIALYDPEISEYSWRGGIYVFNGDGSIRDGWPLLQNESFIAEPVIIDVDQNGQLDIVIPSWNQWKIHALRLDGMECMGWPIYPNKMRSFSSFLSAAIIQNWPTLFTICIGNPWVYYNSGIPDAIGGIVGWWAGSWPIQFSQSKLFKDTLIMEGLGGFTSNIGAPVICDLDGDGFLDVVAATTYDYGFELRDKFMLRNKGRFSVYTWKTHLPIKDKNQLMWSTWRLNSHRHGAILPSIITNQPPKFRLIPSQTIPLGGSFRVIDLKKYITDPDDPIESLSIEIEVVYGKINVFIDSELCLHVSPLHQSWTGEAKLKLTVYDQHGAFDQTVVLFRVIAGYTPPIAIEDLVQTEEDVSIEIHVLDNDFVDSVSTIQIFVTSAPNNGTATVKNNTVIEYTPNKDFYGTDFFEYTIVDELGGSSSAYVIVNIHPLPDPPVCEPDFVRILEDSEIVIDPCANDFDPDGDPFELIQITYPSNGVANIISKRQIYYRPNPNWFGTEVINYTIIDITGLTNTGTIFIQVDPVNDPPIAYDQLIVINRNTKASITFQASDPDNDKLTYEVIVPPKNGEVWLYPDIAEYWPKFGFSGEDSFVYVAYDGQSKSNPATVKIKVLDRNNPPLATNISLTIRTNRVIDIPLQAIDPDKDPLSFILLKPPAFGYAKIIGDLCRYQPWQDYEGIDSLEYAATDSYEVGPPAVISITITSTNTAPTAESKSFKILQDTPQSIMLPINDKEWDPLLVQVIQSPRHGTLEITGTNVIYSPKKGYLGPDSFTYRVFDGELWSATARCSLLVMPNNHPPQIVTNQMFYLISGQRLYLDLKVSDPDNDPLEIVVLKGPSKAFATASGTNLLLIVKDNVYGDDYFTYRVWDGYEYSEVGTVYLRFEEPYKGPIRIENLKLNSDTVTLQIRLTPLRWYILQASSNLKDWEIVTLFYASQNVITVSEPLTPLQVRYYRIKTVED